MKTLTIHMVSGGTIDIEDPVQIAFALRQFEGTQPLIQVKRDGWQLTLVREHIEAWALKDEEVTRGH